MSQPTLALALGGGGARGIAHIHVLEALDDLGIKPVAIAGSSIGAMMGVASAAGMSGQEIREFIVETFSNKSAFLAKLWRQMPSNVGKLFQRGWPKIGELDPERVMRSFLPNAVPENFDQLEIPMCITATDFYAMKGVNLCQGPINRAIAASVAIPAVFRPVVIDGIVCIDGSIANPVPFDRLYDKADILLAIDVVGAPAGTPGEIPGRIEALYGASQAMMQTTTEMKLIIRPPEILLRPDVNTYRVHDFFKVKKILKETAGFKDEVLRALERVIH